MATSSAAKQFSLLLFITLLSLSHARDSKFFSKVSSTNNDNNVVVTNKEQPLNNNNPQKQEEPSFLPEKENAYGLYGHESGQLPPSATTTKGEPDTTTTTKGEPATTTTTKGEPATTTTTKDEPATTVTSTTTPYKKYLPKNYNPVSYVTESEDITDSNTLTEETYTTNTQDKNNYYNGQQEEEGEETGEPEYRVDSFNGNPQGMSDTRFTGGTTTGNRPENYFNDAEESTTFRPEGMSDTRAVENGKYFYDLNSDKYSENHPYESLRGVRERNYYGNSENSMGRYENRYEFQNEENLP